MTGLPGVRRPSLQDIAPLLQRLQRVPTEGATLSCLALRLLWSPPGDLMALEALLQALDSAPVSDDDIPLLRALALGARGGSAAGTARSLTDYAGALEQWGEEDCALLVAGVALRWGGDTLPSRSLVQIHQLRARLYRKAARWSDAAAAWGQVEELARIADDPWIRIRASLGRSVIARYRGNLPKAMALLESARHEAAAAGFTDLLAIAANDLGTILEERGNSVDAAIHYWEAVQLASSESERLRSLGNLGGMLRAVGCLTGARMALARVHREAPDWGDRANAAIELLDIASAGDDMLSFRRLARELERELERMSPAMATDYWYRLGLGRWRCGRRGEARAAWNRALDMAEEHQLGAWIIRLERELERGPEAPPAAVDERACAVDLGVQVLLAGPSAG